jgi:hypothetical protein
LLTEDFIQDVDFLERSWLQFDELLLIFYHKLAEANTFGTLFVKDAFLMFSCTKSLEYLFLAERIDLSPAKHRLEVVFGLYR